MGSWEPHLRATGRHLPYGITQCYLPPDTSELARLTPAMQAGTRFAYPGEMEGWVDLVDLIMPRRESNQQPFDHESDAEPLHHQDNHVP